MTYSSSLSLENLTLVKPEFLVFSLRPVNCVENAVNLSMTNTILY